jgi:acyl phosphate:glycerol-3-phosphate acyltransferase
MTSPDILAGLAAAAGAFVIGATPFGYLAGRLRGVDIREHGSGNVGATNVIRVLGKGIGIPVFALDVLKGWLPVFLTNSILTARGMDSTWPAILAGVATVIGHNYTFWLRFRGGKGIATSAGVLAALLPLPLLVALTLWAVLFFTTRYVAVASIGASLVVGIMPAVLYFVGGKWAPTLPLVIFGALLGTLAVWRHRSNIRRLLEGTENRFTRKKSDPAA